MDNNDEDQNLVPLVSQPENLRIELFKHQLSAIYMMENRENNNRIQQNNSYIETNIGIFADITGYGKTSAIIGLIVRDKFNWDINEKYTQNYVSSLYGNGRIVKYKTCVYNRIKTNLVIANQSLIHQWQNELSYTKLKVYVINTRKKIENCKADNYDVVICSPTMYNKFIVNYKDVAFKRMIYDEPGTTRIPSMKNINAGFNWFITATPEMLLYSYRSSYANFLSSIFSSYMSNNIFKQLIVKNDDDYVKQSYIIPETIYVEHTCYQPMYNMVKGLINSNITDMISAGNISGAVQMLGGTETSNIVDLVTNKIKEKIEEAEYKINLYTRRNDDTRIKEWTNKKVRYENQLLELDDRLQGALNNKCTICYDKMDKTVMLSCCQNFFCGECILQWLERKTTCPLCRSIVTKNNIIYINKDTESQCDKCNNYKRPKTKNETIVELVQNNPEKKFLLFSSFDETFGVIRSHLKEHNIKFLEIQGRSESRKRQIDAFKKGKVPIIFLNSKNNGAGINLQEATDIILYHDMNQSLQTQIIGRANRIGRKKILTVHKLI